MTLVRVRLYCSPPTAGTRGGMATHAALMAAHPTRVRMVAARKLLHFPWVSYMVTSNTTDALRRVEIRHSIYKLKGMYG